MATTLLPTRSAIDGAPLAPVAASDVGQAISAAHSAFTAWREVPAPLRGQLVRRIGELARAEKDALAAEIVQEVGKIPSEARGEIQEWIDICEFAVGLSRQLHGLTIASERPGHRLIETWHPLGPIGVISAFNFPIAVWAWNAMLALVCGDTVVWKPSEKALRCAVAAQALADRAIRELGLPPGLLQLACGGADAGIALAADPRLPLISATGSTRMGRAVAISVAGRLGRSLLELGGNNAAIVTPSADLELAVRAIVFAAAGTAGQRCTTLRRLLVHRSVYDRLVPRLVAVFARLQVGDPREPGTLVGPLIDQGALAAMQAALTAARAQGGVVHGGEPCSPAAGGAYARPALVEIAATAAIVQEETFAPILYVSPYDDFAAAVERNNAVAHGLSSAVLTGDLHEAERFLGPAGSDCGIANVNIGTSGAEIGGAFGGDKATGGGRESGSDSWKAYMRRQTATINGSGTLPLAQGVVFDP
jgi:aldehyde dehydrogenase (NAD+)